MPSPHMIIIYRRRTTIPAQQVLWWVLSTWQVAELTIHMYMSGKKNEYTGICKYDVNTRRQDLSPAVTVSKPSYDPLIEAYEIINSL